MTGIGGLPTSATSSRLGQHGQMMRRSRQNLLPQALSTLWPCQPEQSFLTQAEAVPIKHSGLFSSRQQNLLSLPITFMTFKLTARESFTPLCCTILQSLSLSLPGTPFPFTKAREQSKPDCGRDGPVSQPCRMPEKGPQLLPSPACTSQGLLP